MRAPSLSVCIKQIWPSAHFPTNVNMYVNISTHDRGTSMSMWHVGEMSVNAGMENMAVHFDKQHTLQSRVRVVSMHPWVNIKRVSKTRCILLYTNQTQCKWRMSKMKNSGPYLLLPQPWCMRGITNKSTANVLRRFNVHLFLTRGTYSIKISYWINDIH